MTDNHFVKAQADNLPKIDVFMSEYFESNLDFTSAEIKGVKAANIKVNSVHPGYVDTDMSSHTGPLTIDQGAAAPLFLALDADDSVRGKYVWYTKEIVDWAGEKPEEKY